MKKFILMAVVAVSAVSCLSDTYMEMSVTSYSDFEFTDPIEIFGKDSVFVESAFGGGSGSMSLLFASQRDGEKSPMTGGFGLTMKRDTTVYNKSWANPYPQYTIYDTLVVSNKASAVFYQNPNESLMPEHDIVFLDAAYGTCTPASCRINNTWQTVHNIVSEDSDYRFGEGDYLKLTVTGFLNGAETGSVEYYLADYRIPENGGAAPDSLAMGWKLLSLTKLGNVDNIDFDLETNKPGFPLYFCLDNFVAGIYVKR